MTDIPPPTQVLTAVFLAWASGTIVLTAFSRFWGEIQGGHFKVMWLVSTGLCIATGFGYRPMWFVAILCLAAYGAIYRDADHIVGIFPALVSLFALAAGSDLSPEAFATALLLGSVSNAMLLGHWHLNQPRLGTKPIARLVYVLWGGVVLFLASTALLLRHPRGVQGLAAWTAIGFAAFSLILTAMVTYLVRTRSIMSATGILYLEVLMLLVAGFTGTLGSLAA
jgi:hypothetical protein